METDNPEGGQKPLFVFTKEMVDAANEIVLTTLQGMTMLTAKLKEEQPGLDRNAAEMLAWASLFLSRVRDVDLPIVGALMAAEQLLASRPPSATVH